ncbi:MAG: hypothetical protein AB8G05_00660 [Oligoflexales bacterium]
MVRLILAKIIFLFAFSSFAMEQLIEADGKIFFTNEQGDLVKHAASLSMTHGEDGEKGELSLTVGNQTYTTSKYSSRKKSGRTIFYMAFSKDDDFLNQHKACVFKGTYVRANNLAVYYGDFFRSGADNSEDQEVIQKLLGTSSFHKYKYLGGFAFKRPIER